MKFKQFFSTFSTQRMIAIGSGLLLLTLGLFFWLATRNFYIANVTIAGKSLQKSVGNAAEITINQSEPILLVKYHGWPSQKIAIEIDEQPLTPLNNWFLQQTSVTSSSLSDGHHVAKVSCGKFEENWLFNVDTVAPKAVVSHPHENFRASKNQVSLQGNTEPNCRVEAIINNNPAVSIKTGSQSGFFCIPLPTQQGKNTIRWSVYDSAGNTTSGKVAFSCDLTPPQVEATLSTPPPASQSSQETQKKVSAGPKDPVTVFPSNRLIFSFSAQDKDVGLESCTYRLDEAEPVAVKLHPDNVGQPLNLPDDQAYSAEVAVPQASSTDAEVGLKQPFKYDCPLEGLFEGAHTLKVSAVSSCGLTTARTINFIVDSTEVYGQAALTLGARGKDVSELQRRLIKRGFLKEGYIEGRFDKATREAVIALQNSLAIAADGIAGPLVTSALDKRIYVNLAAFQAVLVEEDDTTRYYDICTGVADHPTPCGLFYIVDMARNPSWLPPNSEWAKNAKVCPPGPDNPLGTRWIGLDAGGVGFHGTPYPDSVGTPASHGCMRMRIPDVEDLYEHVRIGTPVQIFSGHESNPILQKYW